MNDKMNEAPKDAFDVWNGYRKDLCNEDLDDLIDLMSPWEAVIPLLDGYVFWADIALSKLKSTARPDQLRDEINLLFDRKERDIMRLFDALGGASAKTAAACFESFKHEDHYDLVVLVDAFRMLYGGSDSGHKYAHDSRGRPRPPVPEYLRPVEQRIHDFAMFVYIMFEGASYECND